ncbi:MAG: pimeloyl-ACP methyl ester esterase BioH [Succinivibrionaceae bacterium]
MKLYYEEFGITNSTHIVFIHGWGLCSKAFFPIVEQLSQDYHVILLDLPGYGLNNNIPSNRCNGVLNAIEDTIPKNSILLGWSLGGTYAIKYTITHPTSIKGLITIASSPKFTSDNDSHWDGTSDDLLTKFIGMLKISNCQAVINKFLSLQAMGSPTLKQDIKKLKHLLDSVPTPSFYELLSGLKTLQDEDLRNYISRIECPSLHIYGKKDSLVPVPKSNYWNNAKYPSIYVCENSSHAPFISEPNKVVSSILTFLKNNY